MHNVKVSMSGTVFNVMIADSILTRMRGLAWREEIHGDGALIVFPYAGRWPIWMLGMRFAIDVVWMRAGRAVCIWRDIPPPNNLLDALKLLKPDSMVDSALELKMGLLPDGFCAGSSVEVVRAGNDCHVILYSGYNPL